MHRCVSKQPLGVCCEKEMFNHQLPLQLCEFDGRAWDSAEEEVVPAKNVSDVGNIM